MWLFSANLGCESILVGSFFYVFFCALGSAERLSSMGRTHWSFWLVVSGAFTEGTKIEFQQEFSLLSKAILTLSLWLITVMYRLGFSCLFVLLTTANKGIAWERHFFVLRHPSQFAGLCPSLLYHSQLNNIVAATPATASMEKWFLGKHMVYFQLMFS